MASTTIAPHSVAVVYQADMYGKRAEIWDTSLSPDKPVFVLQDEGGNGWRMLESPSGPQKLSRWAEVLIDSNVGNAMSLVRLYMLTEKQDGETADSPSGEGLCEDEGAAQRS